VSPTPSASILVSLSLQIHSPPLPPLPPQLTDDDDFGDDDDIDLDDFM
jgi:hypothetical protein